MRTILILFLSVIFFSCSKKDDRPNNINPVEKHVVILGTTGDSLVVWKDDTLNVLHTGYAPQSYSMPGQMILSDTNIYIAGGSENNRAVYYKNGIKTTLAQYYSYAASISVLNNHVYVAGFSMDNNGSNLGETYTTYWIDGVRNTSYGINTQYHYVLAKDNDIYLLGFQNAGSYSYGDMIYLKNDQPIQLSTYAAEGRRMIVHGSDTYIIGNVFLNGYESHAAVWKNGQETVLDNFSGASSANAIFINGNDVYIAGMINNNAVFWKNGIATQLSNSASAWDIKVVDDDVYVVGRDFNILTGNLEAILWKNGDKKLLSGNSHEANAFSILVK